MKKLLLSLLLVVSSVVYAGEWNEKPIMCSDEVETFDAINSKKKNWYSRPFSSLKSELTLDLQGNQLELQWICMSIQKQERIH